MLAKIGTFGGLLGPKVDHPLADGKELRRVLAELPADNGFKALDEIAGWLDSLRTADDFPAELLLEVLRQLDDAAQPHLRRLGRDYLQASRMSRSEEMRLWTLIRGNWHLLASCYGLCLRLAAAKGRVPDGFKPSLPLLCGRMISALGALNKWDCFHYAPASPAVWEHLGYACLVAAETGTAGRPVQLYPHSAAATTVEQEYLKAMVFQASSVDCLLPLEIDLAEKLIAHLLPHFIFGAESRPESVYWVDLAKAQPPMRLARMPKELPPSLRFFQPGGAQAELENLAKELEAGNDLPRDINLGGQYSARVLLPVIRHLAACLAPVPPQRQHRRIQVKHRMAVAAGLRSALAVFSREAGGQTPEVPMESWVVEDVSLGGFGSVVSAVPAEWLKIGALLALQPEGGENWLLGIIRRCYRDAEGSLRVGIETLAKQAEAVQLKPCGVQGHAGGGSFSALLVREGDGTEEMRFVLPPASFDARESLELVRDGRRLLLTPLGRSEHTPEYEVASYRALAAE
jgi:hypothetical protein